MGHGQTKLKVEVVFGSKWSMKCFHKCYHWWCVMAVVDWDNLITGSVFHSLHGYIIGENNNDDDMKYYSVYIVICELS